MIRRLGTKTISTGLLFLFLFCLTLVGGSKVASADEVVLRPAYISGSVQMGNHTITNFTVYANWGDQQATKTVTVNGPVGNYNLTVNVPEGTSPTYSVYVYAYFSGDLYRVRFSTQSVPVTEFQTSTANFGSATPATITGTVQMGNEPISRVDLEAYSTDGRYTEMQIRRDDTTSLVTYQMPVDVPDGTSLNYTFRYYDTEAYFNNWNTWVQFTQSNNQVTVSVPAGGSVTQNFGTANPGYVQGTLTVVGASLNYGYLYTVDNGPPYTYSRVRVESDGSYSMPVIPNGNIRVYGYAYLVGGAQVNIPSADTDPSDQTYVSVGAGQTATANWTITPSFGAIAGDISFTGPVPVYRHYVQASGPSSKSVYLDDDGAYSLDELIAGSYTVYAYSYFNDWNTYFQYPYGTYDPTRSPAVNPGATTQVDVVAEQSIINGIVAVAGTRTMSEVSSNMEARAYGVNQTPSYGGHGRDRIDMATGAYELVVSEGDWNIYYWEMDFRNYDPEKYIVQNTDLYDYESLNNPIHVDADGTATRNFIYKTGEVTVTFRIEGGGLMSTPRLENGRCYKYDDDTGQQLTYYRFDSYNNSQTNVEEGTVTFAGTEATCTMRARANVDGSWVTFGELEIDVVPGAVIIIDIGGPTLDVQWPEPDSFVETDTVTVTGTATDDVAVSSVTVNGVAAVLTDTSPLGDMSEVSFTAELSGLVLGPNELVTIATDTSDKNATDTRTVYYDTAPPALSFTPANGTVTGSFDITVHGTAQNDVQVTSVTINGSPVTITPTGNPNDYTEVAFSTPMTLQLGPNDITAVATDIAGRTYSETHTVTVADNQPPVCSDMDIRLSEDTTLTVSLPCSDPDTDDTIEVEIVSLNLVGIAPITVTQNSETQEWEVEIRPDTDFNGNGGSFTFQATDAAGADSDEATATITVTPVNDRPVIAQVPAIVLDEGDATTISLDSIVADVETADADLTWTAASSGPGVVSAGIGAGRVLTIGALDGDGLATITLTATDRGDPDNCDSQDLICGDPRAADVTIDVNVVNVAPTAYAGPDQSVYRNDPVDLTGTWTDPAGAADDPYAWEWDLDGDGTPDTQGSAPYGTAIDQSTAFDLGGTYTLTFAVTDKDGGTDSDTVDIEVLNKPPVCDAVTPSQELIWPPNHQFVAISVLGVTDPEGDSVTITIDSIFQDEPVDTFGDGSFTPDGQGVGTSIAEVRAERSGTKKVPGDGRVYHIGFTADDGHGGTCTSEVTVGVPHDQGKKGSTPIDGGTLFDSTIQ